MPTEVRELQELPFEGVFDGVMCVDALEMIPHEDYPVVLAGLRRALRPRGRLYVTIERIPEAHVRRGTEEARRWGLPVLEGEVVWEDDGYHHYPSMDRVRARLAEAGFEIEEEAEGPWAPEGYAYHHVLARRHLPESGKE